MKRDIDLCREILRQIEEHPHSNSEVEIAVEGRTWQEVAYQIYLLDQARLIEAVESTSGDEPDLNYTPMRLTWWGHEFLDAARNDTVWNRAKSRFSKAAEALTFDLLLAVLKEEIGNLIGLDS